MLRHPTIHMKGKFVRYECESEVMLNNKFHHTTFHAMREKRAK